MRDHPAPEPGTRADVIAQLERELKRPVLPRAAEQQRRTREALARSEELLRNSPIGRGEW